MQFLYEKLHENAKPPEKAHELDSGYDVFLYDVKSIYPFDRSEPVDLSEPLPVVIRDDLHPLGSLRGRFNGAHDKDFWQEGQEITLYPGERMMVGTGLKCCVDKDIIDIAGVACTVELQARPRSGLSWKKDILIMNTPGTLDNPYRGETCILLKNNSTRENVTLKVGDKIAQLVPNFVPLLRLKEVPQLPSDTERGDKGFGSSGR